MSDVPSRLVRSCPTRKKIVEGGIDGVGFAGSKNHVFLCCFLLALLQVFLAGMRPFAMIVFSSGTLDQPPTTFRMRKNNSVAMRSQGVTGTIP